MARRPKKPDFSLSSELEFEEYAPQLRLLAPRLRADANIAPQRFRGKTYFVLQDPVTLQFYRIGETEREVLGQLDGRATLGEIHNSLKTTLGAAAPSFADLAHFVFLLRQANLTVPEEAEESRWSVQRATRKRRYRVKQRLSNFMYPTIPLLDPERFLERTVPYVRWIFTRAFFAIWLLTVGAAIFTFFYNFDALTEPANAILAPGNLLFLYLAYVLIKTCHEFGHAFAAKHYGAEVHRMGIMFLILMPRWYVDATPVWAFPRKWHKVLVGCAGMMTELFIASLALFAWLTLEPGVLRTILYNMIFIASVSTILFNGNPLLRYDAYYILADLIEIPNLRQSSSQYLMGLVRRYLVGEKVPPVTQSRYEKAWFIGYGVLATIYRSFIVVVIILYIASKFFVVGAAIAVVVAALWLFTPLVKLVKYVFFDRRTATVRGRAVGVFTLTVAMLLLLVGVLPVATSVRCPCVLQPEEEQVLRAGWPGFLSELYVKDGDRVAKGELLALISNEEVDFQVRRQELTIEESAARLRGLQTRDVAAAQAEAYRLEMLRRDLAALQERRASLSVHSPFDGQVIAPTLDRVHGRFLQLGDELFTVASLDRLRVSAVVDDAEIAAVRQAVGEQVRIKFRSDPGRIYLGAVDRVHPSATNEAPPTALTNAAGGPILLDPSSPGGGRALLPWHRVDIALDAGADKLPLGSTGTVRFMVTRKPIGKQVWMRFRRMLHRRFLI